MYRTSHARNPVTDIIRPNSSASVSISARSKVGRSMDDLLGPLPPDLGVESEGDSLPSPSAINPTSSPLGSLDLSGKDLEEALQDADRATLTATPPLDLCWDLLCDIDTYQVSRERERERERGACPAAIHSSSFLACRKYSLTEYISMTSSDRLISRQGSVQRHCCYWDKSVCLLASFAYNLLLSQSRLTEQSSSSWKLTPPVLTTPMMLLSKENFPCL